MAKALVVAAPSSGSGKTLVTLALLRALRKAGHAVSSAKVGPDYIDPQFHEAASGRLCLNLDLWAMGGPLCAAILRHQATNADVVIIEGVMGLFDGPDAACGSTADLAAELRLPVMLVVDCERQAQSVAALVRGFLSHRADVHIAGVFLNRVKSDRHLQILQESLSANRLPVLGHLRHNDSLHMPSRHLGLVQAQENQDLELLLETAAASVARETMLDRLLSCAKSISNQVNAALTPVPPLAPSVAVARDEAFRFLYPHLLQQWRNAGAALSFFSPLADEAPQRDAAAVFLPGGYPELHAGKLAANATFLNGLRAHTGVIYGECGGYMVLGEALVDAQGRAHRMAGLLPLETSFASPKLHLGYRKLVSQDNRLPRQLRGHEFHYATIAQEGDGERLFEAQSADGTPLPAMGLRRGRVMGSFAHVISTSP